MRQVIRAVLVLLMCLGTISCGDSPPLAPEPGASGQANWDQANWDQVNWQ